MIQVATSIETSLLLTLEETSRLISHSHDPRETLANIVQLIQGRFHTDVCSVYLLEAEQGELVLGATVGLRPDSVGKVRMRLDEGLTGLVAEQRAPVNVVDAFTHPRFKYFPEAGEDPYHSFLGVPLVEGGELQGVLVVQTIEPRAFTANETRMLVTVASQLASLVSGARLLDQIGAAPGPDGPARPEHHAPPPGLQRGIPLSPGIGVGQVYRLDEWESQPSPEGQAGGVGEEKLRLFRAMDGAREELLRLSQRISEQVGEDHGAILQAQLLIMQDRLIEQDLLACLEGGRSAEAAATQTQAKYVAVLQKAHDPVFQERAFDIKDVFRRIQWHLRARPAANPAAERLVLVANEASVLDLFSVDLGRLAGVVVEHGGPQSHAAILARSLGLPMVSHIPDLLNLAQPGRPVLVNGTDGTVRFDPDADLLAHQAVRDQEPEERPWDAAEEATLSPGGPRVEANINLLCEVAQAVEGHAQGVGLYRSEFLFLARRTLPTEEEQVTIYRKLLHLLGGRPVTIRTFDLRPDKLAHFSHWNRTTSRPYDWRLVLESPPMQELFKDQVRAILRAAVEGPARLLVPLVTYSAELDFILATIDRARNELEREGLPYGRSVPLGIMIETAAATALVGAWARQVDFFALGTNDLIASALGIDRNDPVGDQVPDPLHPGVLHLIHDVVSAAHRHNRRVTVCGELATDPDGTLALAALGVDSLSVAVHQLRTVRRGLAAADPEGWPGLAERVSEMRSAADVRHFLRPILPSTRAR